MTQVIDLTNPCPKESKKINFVKAIFMDEISETSTPPYKWENIELISRDYAGGFDLMFAYNDNRTEGCAYLGHFNDGIV